MLYANDWCGMQPSNELFCVTSTRAVPNCQMFLEGINYVYSGKPYFQFWK